MSDTTNGACAAIFFRPAGWGDVDVKFPLWCAGDAHNLRITSWATGTFGSRLRLEVDGIDKQYDTHPPFPVQSTREWPVGHGHLSAGLHQIWYHGDRLDLKSVYVEGDGGMCSFSYIHGYDAGSWTNLALDTLNRVAGPLRDFDSFSKRQLYFSSEVMGKHGGISSTVVADGIWQWLFQYHRDPDPNDTWLHAKRQGGMYDEANQLPYKKVCLNSLPGFEGEAMQVVEPCNTVSNLVYHQTALWFSCKGLPFRRDQYATLLTGLNALAAGSGFFHASATWTGQMADRMAIQLVLYNIHQIMVLKLVEAAPDLWTPEETHLAYTLGSKCGGWAPERAIELTSLYSGPFERAKWFNESNQIAECMPDYTTSIVAIVLTIVESLDRKWPLPGVGSLVFRFVDALLDGIGGNDAEWMKNTYRPIISRKFDSIGLCGSIGAVFDGFIGFALSFGEAFIFQEEQLPVPGIIRELFDFLNLADTTSEMQLEWDHFNGQQGTCHGRSAHSIWHEKSAHGFTKMVKVAEQFAYQIGRGC